MLGMGTDIIEIDRIRSAITRYGVRFLDRLFTEKEISYCHKYKDSATHFAGRFAAKEAIVKAFGTGIGDAAAWKEIEIINNAKGRPEVEVSARLKHFLPPCEIFLSISHCDAYATATAIIIGEK
jgi:holo-[acyl-carrier protein] synthase